jgi:hypothetical protein
MNPLADYVLKHYALLMTPAEAAAHMRLSLTNRSTQGDTSPEAQARVTSSPVNMRQYPDACTDDPEVLALAHDGLEPFARRTAQRILRDHGDEITIARCPGCDAVLESPEGRTCAACGGGAAEAVASA